MAIKEEKKKVPKVPESLFQYKLLVLQVFILSKSTDGLIIIIMPGLER